MSTLFLLIIGIVIGAALPNTFRIPITTWIMKLWGKIFKV
jgi:hypothetical protein